MVFWGGPLACVSHSPVNYVKDYWGRKNEPGYELGTTHSSIRLSMISWPFRKRSGNHYRGKNVKFYRYHNSQNNLNLV
jgi:hypothetical protein